MVSFLSIDDEDWQWLENERWGTEVVKGLLLSDDGKFGYLYTHVSCVNTDSLMLHSLFGPLHHLAAAGVTRAESVIHYPVPVQQP